MASPHRGFWLAGAAALLLALELGAVLVLAAGARAIGDRSDARLNAAVTVARAVAGGARAAARIALETADAIASSVLPVADALPVLHAPSFDDRLAAAPRLELAPRPPVEVLIAPGTPVAAVTVTPAVAATPTSKAVRKPLVRVEVCAERQAARAVVREAARSHRSTLAAMRAAKIRQAGCKAARTAALGSI